MKVDIAEETRSPRNTSTGTAADEGGERGGGEEGEGEEKAVSPICKTLLPFYDDAARVTQPNFPFKFDHFSRRLVRTSGWHDQRIVHRERGVAVVFIARKAPDQLAIDPHQAHTGITAKVVLYRHVAALDGRDHVGGVPPVGAEAIGQGCDRRGPILGVDRDVEAQLDVRPFEPVDVIGIAAKRGSPTPA